MTNAALLLAALIAAAGPAAGALAVGWDAYADCAAAYRVNAQIADPDRPAAMTAQISEVAGDYAAAAKARYARRFGTGKSAAGRAVAARIGRQAQRLAGQPREAVEKIIDACPQVDS